MLTHVRANAARGRVLVGSPKRGSPDLSVEHLSLRLISYDFEADILTLLHRQAWMLVPYQHVRIYSYIKSTPEEVVVRGLHESYVKKLK